MSKFERIVREPLVMGGQARIRDTGVTVNEIVRLSLAGSSQAEILQEFPMLETEDVHQVLGWHSDFLIDTASNFIFELKNPVSIIQGYIDIIEMDIAETNEDKTWLAPSLENIRRKASRISYIVDDLSLWIRVRETPRSVKVNRIHWNSVQGYMSEEDFEAITSESKKFEHGIAVLCVTDVERIISLLCNERLASDTHFRGRLTIRHEGNELRFIITYTQTIIEVKRIKDSYALYLAQLLIQGSGSELKIRQEENSVIFEFSLPIAQA